jgi:thioester reductase-like protein
VSAACADPLPQTTGGVGAHILEQALKSESIEKVFAVNRPSQAQSIKARHQATFTDRGLDVALLDSPKLSLLEARLEDGQTFGLRDDVYAALRDETTCIYHVRRPYPAPRPLC